MTAHSQKYTTVQSTAVLLAADSNASCAQRNSTAAFSEALRPEFAVVGKHV